MKTAECISGVGMLANMGPESSKMLLFSILFTVDNGDIIYIFIWLIVAYENDEKASVT